MSNEWITRKLGMAVLLALVTTWSVSKGADMSVTEREAVAIADAFVSETYRDFDLARSRVAARDDGTYIEVVYLLPLGMVGGGPIVRVDKSSGEVIWHVMTQ